MAGERYRHIFLPGPPAARGFTNPQRGGSAPRIRDRDREAHSQFLEQRLLATWADADARRALVQVERNGVYVEFASDPGFDLMVQGLEATRSGIRLTNIRTVGEGRQEQTRATVYVPSAKRGNFLKKIRAYALENTSGREPKPKNADLINSIADIRLAVLESFWRTDE